jgi:DNA (cytosine-5)-methyltransferase 1
MSLDPRRVSLRPTALSLFSGCGGLDLGLEQAGFRLVAGTDAEPLAKIAHNANFPDAAFRVARIGDLSREDIFDLVPEVAAGTLDLLAGGPPCPPFSKSRFYRTEKPRALDDPNGLETITGFLNVLDWTRPRSFLLENVRGLAYDVHSGALDAIKARAEGLGYNVSIAVLNSADYGVAQIRERCFVVGVRHDLKFRFPLPSHAEGGLTALPRWKTAGEVLSDLDTPENADLPGHFAGGQHNDLLKLVPPGDNYLFFTAERGHPSPVFGWRKRYWSFLLKLSPDKPSWTIQARRSNNMGPFHWRNRILTIAEIKRLQGFPDDFKLAGTTEAQWRQIGNAVPPPLAAAVGSSIMASLESAEAPLMAAE